MDFEELSPVTSTSLVKCCNCGCSCSPLVISSSSPSWLRSVKRKYDEFEEGKKFVIPGFDFFANPRVEIENECAALREMVANQQQTIQDLHTELEEERNASSSAANEAMSMILRLQREKAEVQMEARQFKRFAEEKMAHDGEEMFALEDLLYKREQALQSLTCEVQAYKHRMLSYGLTEAEVDGDKGERGAFSRNASITENLDGAQYELPLYDYPPLKCNLNENPYALEGEEEAVDIEKYAFGETPRSRDHLKNLEYRIGEIEKYPSSNQLDADFPGSKNILEKVVVGHSPRRSRHIRRISTDSSSSFLGTSKEPISEYASDSPRFKLNNGFKKMDCVSQKEEHLKKRMDNSSEFGDDMSPRVRVYTVDSVHNVSNGVTENKAGGSTSIDYMSTPRGTFNQPDINDPEIKKLYARLQALEADRESMRQAIISMRTDKAQLVLLKEIAQQLCKEMTPEKRLPVKKPSLIGSFSFLSIFKWVASFIFWRKRARQSKYLFGLTASNPGLLMLLDRGPRTRQWRCLTSTQV